MTWIFMGWMFSRLFVMGIDPTSTFPSGAETIGGAGGQQPQSLDGAGGQPPKIMDGAGGQPPKMMDGAGGQPPARL
jgi:hypothetical protein